VLDLESRVVEVAAPKEVVNDEPRICTHWGQLVKWDGKTEVDVDKNYQTVVNQQLHRQSMSSSRCFSVALLIGCSIISWVLDVWLSLKFA
jgi:hypothetical protein